MHTGIRSWQGIIEHRGEYSAEAFTVPTLLLDAEKACDMLQWEFILARLYNSSSRGISLEGRNTV